MKFPLSLFCLLLVFLSACGGADPINTPESTTLAPTATQQPLATNIPDPTETPLSATFVPPLTLEPTEQPGPRAMGDMVFHERLGMIVLINGNEDDQLWGWDGVQWQVIGDSGPDGRELGGVAYDPQRDKLVVYGGRSLVRNECVSVTWEWDNQGWQVLAVPGPDVCSHFTMEYDASLEKVVLYGGGDDQQNISSDMWTWDGQQWERLDITTPPVRFHAMSSADAVHQNLFLLGGFDVNNQMLDEFWGWDGTAWAQLNLALPPTLSHARMAFDTNRMEIVLFGGTTRPRLPFALQNDTWVLTDGAWQQVNSGGPAPSPRGGHVMAYDPVRERVVLYGGFDTDDQRLADTWEWDGSTWHCMYECEAIQEIIVPPAFDPDIILYRGNAQRTGIYDFPAIRTQPDLLWQTDPTHLTYFDNLLLHDGVLYIGGSDGKLYAFDAQTGAELWQGGDFHVAVSAAAIAGDVLVIGGYDRFVQALDRHTGESIWKVETVGRTMASPLILEDRVYVSATNAFYALDLQTGELLWTVPLPSDNEFDFVSAPAYSDGMLFMSVGQSFVALDSATGELRWQVQKETYFYFSALGQSLAYVGNGDGFFYAYDLTTGEEIWKFAGGEEIWFGPAVTGDTVYVGHFNGFLYALDALTGEKRWEFATPHWAVSDAVVSAGIVYFTDCNHDAPQQECHLYALEATTGEELWQYAATGTLLSTPVLGEDTIYLVLSARVLALR